MRPVCGDCILREGSIAFCSAACRAKYGEFQQRERALAARRRTARRALPGWIGHAGIGLLAAGILYYVFVMQGVRSVGDFMGLLRRMF